MDGIKERAGNTVQITEHLRDNDLGQASQLAAEADVAIVFVNSNSGEEFITVEGHKGDRNHLSLWHDCDRLVISHLKCYFYFLLTFLFIYRSIQLLMPIKIPFLLFTVWVQF